MNASHTQFHTSHLLTFQTSKNSLPTERGGSVPPELSSRTSQVLFSIGNIVRRFLPAIVLQALTLTFLAEWGDRSQIATIGARGVGLEQKPACAVD